MNRQLSAAVLLVVNLCCHPLQALAVRHSLREWGWDVVMVIAWVLVWAWGQAVQLHAPPAAMRMVELAHM